MITNFRCTDLFEHANRYELLPDPIAYGRDLWERSVLFLDTLRVRADNISAHERAGLPPLLDFKVETLMDARELERPANDALLRITEVEGNYWDDRVDVAKSPVIGLLEHHGDAALNLKIG